MSDAATNNKSISVAIIGGGICGLATAISLLQFDHIDVQVYEAAHAFGEVGAGLNIGPNARNALRSISFAAHEALERILTRGQYEPRRDCFLSHRFGTKDLDEIDICSNTFDRGMTTAHRARYLDELIKLIPQHICHFNKRLEKLSKNGNGINLEFKDGTTSQASVVIGADGLHSVVRSYIFGHESTFSHPTFAKVAAYRRLVPKSEAIAALGEELFGSAFVHWGTGKSIISYPIEQGELFNLSIVDYEVSSWTRGFGKVVPTSEERKSLTHGWSIEATKVAKLIDHETTSVWGVFVFPKTPTYVSENLPIAVVGDAAHAMLPSEGQGAGQAIEDALILGRLLGHAKNQDQVASALAAYNRARLPRTSSMQQTAKELGGIYSGKDARLWNLPPTQLRIIAKSLVERRYDWIWNVDVEYMVASAIKMMDDEENEKEKKAVSNAF